MIDSIKKNRYEEVRRCLRNDLEDPIEGLECVVELDEEKEKKLDPRIIDLLIQHANTKKKLEPQKNNLFIKAGRRHSYLKNKIEEAIASKKRLSKLIDQWDTSIFFEVNKETEKKLQSPKKKPIKERIKPSRISYKKWGAVVLVSCLVVWFNFRYQQLGKRNIPQK